MALYVIPYSSYRRLGGFRTPYYGVYVSPRLGESLGLPMEYYEVLKSKIIQKMVLFGFLGGLLGPLLWG